MLYCVVPSRKAFVWPPATNRAHEAQQFEKTSVIIIPQYFSQSGLAARPWRPKKPDTGSFFWQQKTQINRIAAVLQQRWQGRGQGVANGEASVLA